MGSPNKMAKGNLLKLIGLTGFVLLFAFNGLVECQKKKSESSSLTDRYQQIMDLSSKRTVIRLNGNKYRDLVKSSPRNYSVVVMFTAISRWVGEQTEIQIRVLRPPNYSATIALVALFAVIGGLLYLRRNNLEFLYNKTMWAVLSLFLVFTMTSGQMWNHIRGPPFVHRTNTGNIAYVHGTSQGQFVLETYIVIGISALTVLGMILLTEAASGKGDIKKRRIMSVVGL